MGYPCGDLTPIGVPSTDLCGRTPNMTSPGWDEPALVALVARCQLSREASCLNNSVPDGKRSVVGCTPAFLERMNGSEVKCLIIPFPQIRRCLLKRLWFIGDISIVNGIIIHLQLGGHHLVLLCRKHICINHPPI